MTRITEAGQESFVLNASRTRSAVVELRSPTRGNIAAQNVQLAGGVLVLIGAGLLFGTAVHASRVFDDRSSNHDHDAAYAATGLFTVVGGLAIAGVSQLVARTGHGHIGMVPAPP